MNKVLLHLSMLSGVGPSAVAKILKVTAFCGLSKIYAWSARDFSVRCGFSSKLAKTIHDGLTDGAFLDQELRLIEKHGASWTTIMDSDYPELLKEINSPPTVLYWFGEHPKNLINSIAIIGSRKANLYGKHVIEMVIPPLVVNGFQVVSGGAIGADSMAHFQALECGGKTCAVVGSGLISPYPRSNKKLFERILNEGGTVLSPFPMDMQALPGNFPARNRIISGISRATVVVQAAKKSGARITAMFALDQGREVCAIPGPIDDPLSEGCHKLILEGATLVMSGEDILDALGYSTNKVCEKRDHCAAGILRDPILEFCRRPQTFDEIMEEFGHDFSHLQEKLLGLQLGGKLEQDFSGRWGAV